MVRGPGLPVVSGLKCPPRVPRNGHQNGFIKYRGGRFVDQLEKSYWSFTSITKELQSLNPAAAVRSVGRDPWGVGRFRRTSLHAPRSPLHVAFSAYGIHPVIRCPTVVRCPSVWTPDRLVVSH